MEDTAVGFASLYAIEQWGGASMVEIKLRREPIVPFAQRNDENSTTKTRETYIGWRDTKEFSQAAVLVWS
ncbi:hypothetical protein AARI_26560 [Glutamicibacter arilaitensis Re117]|nr:hypothetical protein AARI_26560 [Glutamicibacter arilaitensis Re117]